MALRPLLLASVVGIAALGVFHTPSAQARGYVSISIGAPAPHHYRNQHHRPDQVWVPAHWVSTRRGRVWVPAQYVRAQGYRDGHYRDRYVDQRRHDTRVIYRSSPVVPRSYYPPGYLSPFEQRRRRGW